MTNAPSSDDAIGELAVELRRAVARISRRVRAERGASDLGDTAMSVLTHLVKHGPRMLRELSEQERVTPPAMNQTVNTLVSAGLVAKTSDPDDGRKVLIVPTDAGASLVGETRRMRQLWLASRLAALGDDELRTLSRAARILTELADS